MCLLLPILLLQVRKATFGKLFKTTKYGSETLLKKYDHQRIIAIIIPMPVPSKKPINVSMHVTLMCINKLLEDKFIKVCKILLGLLIIKLSITPFFAAISQTIIKIMSILICATKILVFCIYFFLKYFFLSSEIFFLGMHI